MSQLKYIFDLDSTLFDTQRFFGDLIDILADEYDIDPNRFRQEERHYRDETGSMYDFFRHLSEYTADDPPVVVQKIWPKFKSSYLYSDVRPVLNNKNIQKHSRIVTIGESKYQHIKLALAGLHQYPHTIIQEPKIPFIEAKLAPKTSEQLTLVDDKAMTFDHPSKKDLKLYQIIRRADQQKSKQSNVTIIESFDELDFKD